MLACFFASLLASHAQTTKTGPAGNGTMAEDYAAAQHAAAEKEFASASTSYKRFISEALKQLAARRASSGDLAKSAMLLEEATELAPSDASLRLDYAGACRLAGDLAKAKDATEIVLSAEPRNAKAYLELGRTLSQMGDDAAATSSLEKAVATDPNFENGYALARQYLKRKKPELAAQIFVEMQAGLGDVPELHEKFGSAYAEAGYPEMAIPEFKKVLAKNEKFRGGHYSLGAAYLRGLGNAMDDQAEAEFRRELKNYPDDPLSLYQLGNIEFNRHKLLAAERDVTQAEKADDSNPDTYLLLGQIYLETGRAPEAEAALRKSIGLTVEVARNNYQVQRAHYLLGRLLAQEGRRDDAQTEMNIANELLKERTEVTQGLSPAALPRTSRPPVHLDAEKVADADAFEGKIKDVVADSYDNLGAIAAASSNFPAALRAFRKAANWNPLLEGLDENWGRAAFSAGDYEQAVGPLSRQLIAHPSDDWAREALGSSYFSLEKYRAALEYLRPIEREFADRPQLSYIYAVSEIEEGESEAGISRLLVLEKTNPDVAAVPAALAEAYAGIGQMDKAQKQREIVRSIGSKHNRNASQKSN